MKNSQNAGATNRANREEKSRGVNREKRNGSILAGDLEILPRNHLSTLPAEKHEAEGRWKMLRHATTSAAKSKTASPNGLTIRNKGGNPEVRIALERFATWVLANYDFPIPVPVYLYPSHYLITITGERVASSFFAPDDPDDTPYIRIATGDYPSLKKEIGRDNALASFINSMSHQIIYYRQWIRTGQFEDESSVARKAVKMLRQYEKTVDRP